MSSGEGRGWSDPAAAPIGVVASHRGMTRLITFTFGSVTVHRLVTGPVQENA
ncbi:MAG TPA: hypothetical protein VNT60_04955 [Deinococcales bacterium]|nr:hypothetical protein [Deinococcales bacterium]